MFTDHAFMTSTRKVSEVVLNLSRVCEILLLLSKNSVAHFAEVGGGGDMK